MTMGEQMSVLMCLITLYIIDSFDKSRIHLTHTFTVTERHPGRKLHLQKLVSVKPLTKTKKQLLYFVRIIMSLGRTSFHWMVSGDAKWLGCISTGFFWVERPFLLSFHSQKVLHQTTPAETIIVSLLTGQIWQQGAYLLQCLSQRQNGRCTSAL